jgi:aminoglycoside 6'-N-acetyltransferase I
MRQALWPSDPGEHAGEIAAFFAGDRRNPAEVLLAFDDDGEAIGFAEISIRPYAFLEGWFVEEEHRRRDVGAALVAAVERWGRNQGCTELASDTGIDNLDSAAAHRAVGFTEVGQIRCFRKSL